MSELMLCLIILSAMPALSDSYEAVCVAPSLEVVLIDYVIEEELVPLTPGAIIIADPMFPVNTEPPSLLYRLVEAIQSLIKKIKEFSTPRTRAPQ